MDTYPFSIACEVGKSFSKAHIRSRRVRGFSLMEILIVISVMGIMSALSIPVLANVSRKAQINKNQRNAQALSAATGAALAAGANIDLSTLETAITQLKVGVQGSATFNKSTFKVAPFNTSEIEGIRPYVSISSNGINYNSSN